MGVLELPLLSFSVQAANKAEITGSNPYGYTRQAGSSRVADWALKPDGCATADRLAELAPGCGWIADRVMGLCNGGYDIGPYAGVPGRRCEKVWPMPLTAGGARFAALADLSVLAARGMRPAVFVGSPMHRTKDDHSNALEATTWIFEEAANAALLASRGIIPIYDTGGTVGESDARRVFKTLAENHVPFYIEPTRPMCGEAVATIRFATGLVSMTEVMRTAESETIAGTRHWFTDLGSPIGPHGVEWCTGISVQYAMERARLRLLAGRRVIVPLRLLSEDQIRQLVEWSHAGDKTPKVAADAVIRTPM